jgi:hypothetical protein
MNLDFRYDELKCIKGWYDICFANNIIRQTERDEQVVTKVAFMIVELINQEIERKHTKKDEDFDGDESD